MTIQLFHSLTKYKPWLIPNEVTENISMKWFKFYTYVKHPFIIINQFMMFFYYRSLDFGIISQLSCIFSIIFIFTIIYLLSHRRKLGWYLNIIYLIVFELIFVFPNVPYVVFRNEYSVSLHLVMIGVILPWVIPNLIYFMKRKSLFTNQNDENQR